MHSPVLKPSRRQHHNLLESIKVYSHRIDSRVHAEFIHVKVFNIRDSMAVTLRA